ncbi:SUMF1/EgtB/PvdO family nonheme iron enzyme [Haliangium sp.]|uniref:SUMF1/EgtB/PvdO family nonheme iron enzyme n=1 Tax=Haliangium sp. TaxID=2663208 RepID=UPI003D0E2B3E
MERVRILFLAASPADRTRLASDDEAREIEAKLRAATHRDAFEFITKWAARPDDLVQALNQHRPHVVHFSGHAGADESLILVDDDGHARPVSGPALGRLFQTLRDDIRVVVLSGCYAPAQAEAIAAHIDCVVGLPAALGPQATVRFSASFYRALAFGRTVENAFEQGLVSLALQGMNADEPALVVGRPGVVPARIVLVGAAAAVDPADPAPAGPHDTVPGPAAPVRPAAPARARRPSTRPPGPDFDAALGRYARWLRRRLTYLDMTGLRGNDLLLELDEVFVPLHLRVPVAAGAPAEPVMTRFVEHPVHLRDAFPRALPARHLLLVGEPGAGKSTVLDKLAWSTLAGPGGDRERERDDFDGTSLGLPRPTVPVLMRLRELGAHDLGRPLADFVDAHLVTAAGPDADLPSGFGRWLWQRGHLLLLCDGLHEIATPGRRQAVCEYLEAELSRATAEGRRGIHAVVTSRPDALGAGVGFGADVARVEISPLDDQQLEHLVVHWFVAAARAQARAHHEALSAAGERGRVLGEALAQHLCAPNPQTRRLRELAGNPLMLTLLCTLVFAGRRLPTQRAEFFRECLRVLLHRGRVDGGDPTPALTGEEALALLRPLAWRLHSEGRQGDLSRAELRAALGPALDRLAQASGRALPFARVFDWLHRGTGVLTELGPDAYGFAHLGLQEYLCAAYVATGGDEEVAALASRFGAEWWREVVLSFAELADPARLSALMQRVLATDALVREEALVRACLDLAQAPDTGPFAEIIAARGETDERRAAALRLILHRADDKVRDAAVRAALDAPPASPLKELADSVEEAPPAAALVGSRGFVDADTGIRFLWVPGGRFAMGSDDISAFFGAWTRPVHQVELSPFWISALPVTNRQYQRFLHATGHPEPRFWRDRRFAHPRQPVVGVSWHDARAFCSWLSAHCGRPVDLPSEAQWEFAARGEDGRSYPWGWEPPDEHRAYFGRDWDKSGPLPAGSLPGGRGPFGTLDQAGNVLEWCRDVWREDVYAGRGALTVDPVGPDPEPGVADVPRAVRGGCYGYPAETMRAAFRGWYYAGVADRMVGFRVVAGAADD